VSGASTSAGFLFALPPNTTSEASILYTTNLNSTTTLQDAPQGDWFRAGGSGTLSGLTLGDISSISFYARNGTTAPVMRLALQVGTTWYASNSTFQTTQTTNFEQFTLSNPIGFNWYSGVFVPGTSLSADVTALPSALLAGSSVVTGYGVYSDIGGIASANDARVRIDSFVVTTVPEPTTWALLVGSLTTLVIFRRHRQA